MPYKDPQKQKQAQRNAYLKKLGKPPEFEYKKPALEAEKARDARAPEIARRYAAGESAKALANEFGMSKIGIQSIVRKHGVPVRGKAEAGLLCRTVDTTLTAEELADTRSISKQLAEKLGYASHKGLSGDRQFQTAAARERRRRSAELYRSIDKRRKEHLYRIPKWQDPADVAAFYEMARDLGLEVDHIIPLQGENVCGLNVISNLRLVSRQRNQSKQNKLLWTSDPLIGIPRVSARVSKPVLRVISSA